MRYQHTQTGYVVIWALLGASVLVWVGPISQQMKAAQQRRTPKAGAVTWKCESRLQFTLRLWSGALGLFGNESISPVRGTSVKQLKFAHHLLRARHGKSLFAFD